MSDLELKDLTNISSVGVLGTVADWVVGFNMGIVSLKSTWDENSVLGTAF